MVTLTFRPVRGESPTLVRGAHFRIHAGTLRGPDNALIANYTDGLWQLGRSQHRSFECDGPVFLTVTDGIGLRERLGPYDLVKATGGALFARDLRIGAFVQDGRPGSNQHWREIMFQAPV
ncbi:MAG: hypothetical protein WBE92_06385 [Steroidobacteraceae bacterium]